MVMQLTADLLVGGSNPGRVNMAAALPTTVDQPRFEPPTQDFAVGCVTIPPAFHVAAKGQPAAWSLLSKTFDPPPPPHTPTPLKKVISNFRG